MEHYDLNLSKWIETNDLSGSQYSVKENIWFKTSKIRFVVKGKIGILAAAANEDDQGEKDFEFKSNAPVRLDI